MIQYKFEEQPVFVHGDIHGRTLDLASHIGKELSNCILIIAGDIGLGFETDLNHKMEYSNMNDKLMKENVHLFLVRGNHDDPRLFNEKVIDYEFVKAIPDYTIITVGDRNILCVGGATSIDRRMRIERYHERKASYEMLIKSGNLSQEDYDNVISEQIRPWYWEGEQPVYDEEKLDDILSNLNIDYVITHTSPSFAYPTTKNGIEYWMELDSELEKDVDHERKVLEDLYDYLVEHDSKPIKWVYGHYHQHHEQIIDDCKFITLQAIDYYFDLYDLNKEESYGKD